MKSAPGVFPPTRLAPGARPMPPSPSEMAAEAAAAAAAQPIRPAHRVRFQGVQEALSSVPSRSP
eukprot:3666651-Karenia_brevis.AAC.1